MIYLEDKDTAQVVQIPNNGIYMEGMSLPAVVPAVFTMRSTTQREQVYDIAANILFSTALYYHMSITLPEGPERWHTALKTGEYEYELRQDGKMLSSGVVQIGEYTRTAHPSESGGISFRQGK